MRKVSSILIVAMVLLLANSAFAKEAWIATPKAEHHKACVDITDGTFGGSGTVIHVDSKTIYVLSCRHVVKKGTAVRVTFTWGMKLSGTVTADGGGDVDLCLIELPHKFENWKDIITVPVAAGPPKAGQFVECTGYGVDGDGGDNLRHWIAKIHGYKEGRKQHMILETSCVSGDSGGGVIYGGRLVGVIWGGSERTNLQGKNIKDAWGRSKGMFVHPAQATNIYKVLKFLRGANGKCIPWLPGKNPGTLPGPAKANCVTKPQLDTALLPIQKDLTEHRSLIGSLGSALSKIAKKIGVSQTKIDKAITDAKTKAAADREDLIKKTSAALDAEQLRSKDALDALEKAQDAQRDKDSKANADGRSKLKTVLGAAIAEKKESGGVGLGTWTGIAALAGFTGPIGLGVGLIAMLGSRRLKKRILERDGSGGPSDPFPQPGDDREKIINDLMADNERLRHSQSASQTQLSKELFGANATIATLTQELEVARRTTRNRYVHVPTNNLEAESLKAALARVAGFDPRHEPVVKLIEGIAKEIFHGAKVMAQDKREPLKEKAHVS